MTTILKDELTFVSPDGGEIVMRMENYPPKEIERMKARLLENGWEFVGHDISVVENSLLERIRPYVVAIVFGMVLQWVVQALLFPNV